MSATRAAYTGAALWTGTGMTGVLDELLSLLDLEEIEENHYRGQSPDDSWQRVYGGQVLGQALVAASRTVDDPERHAHSLHAYFLRPGDPSVPLLYVADRIRDGRSFTTRRVVAIQHGRAIFTMSISFQLREDGLEHQFPMPDVAPPEDLEPEHLIRRRQAEAAGMPAASACRRRMRCSGSRSSGGATSGMGNWCSRPRSRSWKEIDMVKMARPCWMATTRRVVKERPSRIRSTT